MRMKKILSCLLSFVMVFCLVPAVSAYDGGSISLDEETIVVIDDEGDSALFEFTCPYDGTFVFYSYADSGMDTKAYIYDSAMDELAYDDDGGDGNNFSVGYYMTEGELYYLEALFYSSGTGEFPVMITNAPAPTEMSINSPMTGVVGENLAFFIEFGPGACAQEEVQWSSSDENVAVLISEGSTSATFCLVGAGTADITAVSESGLTAQTTATAIVPEELVEGTPVYVQVRDGSSGYYSFAPQVTGPYVFSFTTETPDCYPLLLVRDENFSVLIDSGAGSEKMSMNLEAGERYNLTVRYGSYSGNGEGEIELKVARPVQATGMVIVPDTDKVLRVGQKQYFKADFLPWNATAQSVTWSVSDNDAVEIVETADQNCRLKFNDAGTFTLYGSTVAGLSASLDVTVSDYDPIVPGDFQTAIVNGDRDYGYFKFVCEQDGTYEFYSVAGEDTYGAVFDADLSELNHDDDSGEGTNFNIRFEAFAGETYLLGARFYNFDNSGEIRVALKKVVFPASLSIERLPKMTSMYEGFCDDDYLDLAGLVLEVEWSDASTSLYSFDRFGWMFEGFDLEAHCDRDGSDAVVTLTLDSCSVDYRIPVVPVDVTGIELIRSEEHVLVEDLDGSYEEDEDENGNVVSSFIYYVEPTVEQIRIDYADGTSRVASVWDRVKGYTVSFGALGNTVWNPWDLGEHEALIGYLGFTVSVPFTVVPNRVESIELSGIDHVEFYDHANGHEFDYREPDGVITAYYYYYDYSDFEGLNVIINYDDGTSVTAKPGDVIDGHAVTVDDDQYNDPWGLGESNVTVEYMDRCAYLPVTLVENPVASISIYQPPRDEYEFGDLRYGNMEGEEYGLNPESLDLEGIGVLVNFTDGTDATLDSSAFNSDFTVTVPGIGNVPYRLEAVDTVDEGGGPVQVYMEIMGMTDSFFVNVNPASVGSLSVVSLPSDPFHFAGYMPRWDGLRLQVAYNNGPLVYFAVDPSNSGYVIDMNYGAVFFFDLNGIRGYITIDPENDVYTVRYGGQSCTVDGIALLTESPVESTDVSHLSTDGNGIGVTLYHEDLSSDDFVVEDVVVNPDYVIAPGVRIFVTETNKGYLTYIIAAESPTLYRFGFPSLDVYTTISVDPTLYGDLNGDGAIDTVDLTLLRQYLADNSTAVDQAAADTDGSGTVDTVDLTLLRQYLADNSVALGPRN